LKLHPRAASFKWKLNSSLLSDAAYRPAFSDFWDYLVTGKKHFPGSVAAWWEEAAKPAIQDFCPSFS
jgi:hypothetical protein